MNKKVVFFSSMVGLISGLGLIFFGIGDISSGSAWDFNFKQWTWPLFVGVGIFIPSLLGIFVSPWIRKKTSNDPIDRRWSPKGRRRVQKWIFYLSSLGVAMTILPVEKILHLTPYYVRKGFDYWIDTNMAPLHSLGMLAGWSLVTWMVARWYFYRDIRGHKKVYIDMRRIWDRDPHVLVAYIADMIRNEPHSVLAAALERLYQKRAVSSDSARMFDILTKAVGESPDPAFAQIMWRYAPKLLRDFLISKAGEDGEILKSVFRQACKKYFMAGHRCEILSSPISEKPFWPDWFGRFRQMRECARIAKAQKAAQQQEQKEPNLDIKEPEKKGPKTMSLGQDGMGGMLVSA